MSVMSVEIEKKKRAANSPLAANGKELKGSDVYSSPVSSAATNTSYAKVTALGSPKRPMRNPALAGVNQSDHSFFRTEKPQGGFRDEIVVEVNTLDGVDFKGTVTTKEAIGSIFVGALGFEKKVVRQSNNRLQ